MKTLKIAFAIFFLAGLLHSPTSAQPNKILKGSFPAVFDKFPVPCIGETVSGTLTINYALKTFSTNKNRVGIITQHFTNTGTLIGDDTKTVYTIKERWNYHDMTNISLTSRSANSTSTSWTLTDGEKVIRWNARAHLTLVDGDVKVFFEVEDVKCF